MKLHVLIVVLLLTTLLVAFSPVVAAEIVLLPAIANHPPPIPETELQALVMLYNTTAGPSWLRRDGWLENGQPCTWWGVTCENGHVIGLRLSGHPDICNSNNVTGRLPAELGNLSRLQILMLCDNPLSGPIPPELGNLDQLGSLVLFNNQLIGSIPPQLGDNQFLLVLYLSNNQLSSEIPQELGNLSNLVSLLPGGNLPSLCLPSTLIAFVARLPEDYSPPPGGICP
jgi:hypothetical protein